MVALRPRDKRPIIPWERLQEKSADPAEVADWFEQNPTANVGIVTGRLSGLVVLDVDPGHGGESSLSQLEREYGSLPQTVSARTGGGGRHYYFRHPGGVVRNKVGFRPGLDIRGDGGLIVAPPSIHPSGRRYRWLDGASPEEIDVAPAPSWLAAAMTEDERHSGRPLAYWRALVRDGVEEGRRNNTIASLAGHLFWHEVDAEIVTELLLCWNRSRARPPLSDEEVVQTVQNIARLHDRRQKDASDDE